MRVPVRPREAQAGKGGPRGRDMAAGNQRQTDDVPRQQSWRDLAMPFLARSPNGEKLSPEIRFEQMRMLVEAQKLPLPYAFPLLMIPIQPASSIMLPVLACRADCTRPSFQLVQPPN